MIRRLSEWKSYRQTYRLFSHRNEQRREYKVVEDWSESKNIGWNGWKIELEKL